MFIGQNRYDKFRAKYLVTQGSVSYKKCWKYPKWDSTDIGFFFQVGNNKCISQCSHCVLLEHYYSVDFPWWFDRKKSESFCVRQFWKLLKKFVKSECEESYKNDLTEFFWVRFFQKQMFFPKSSNWSGGQTHGWIFMK